MATKPILNLEKIKEPFDLKTALQYMTDNGEFVRFKHDDQDFYLYLATEARPVVVDGRRKLIELTNVRAFDKWHTPITSFDLTQLFEKSFYIMQFDSRGEPIWEETTTEVDTQPVEPTAVTDN